MQRLQKQLEPLGVELNREKIQAGSTMVVITDLNTMRKLRSNFSITRGNRVGWINERSDGSTHCAGFGGSASLDPPYIFVACPGLLRSYIADS